MADEGGETTGCYAVVVPLEASYGESYSESRQVWARPVAVVAAALASFVLRFL